MMFWSISRVDHLNLTANPKGYTLVSGVLVFFFTKECTRPKPVWLLSGRKETTWVIIPQVI